MDKDLKKALLAALEKSDIGARRGPVIVPPAIYDAAVAEGRIDKDNSYWQRGRLTIG